MYERETFLIAAALSGDFAPRPSWLCSADAAPAASGGAAPALTATPPAAPAPKAAASAPAPGKPAGAPAKPAEAAKPAETPAVAAPAVTPPADASPPKDPAAIAWAKLTAAEKRLANERAEVTKEKTAIAKEREALSTREKAVSDGAAQAAVGLEALRKRAAAGEHDAVLRELGLDYSTLTKARLSNPKSPTEKRVAAEVSAVLTADDVEKRVKALLAERDADARAAAEKAAKEAEEAKASSAAQAWSDAVSTFEGLVKSGGPAKFEELTVVIAKRPSLVHDALKELAQRAPELTYEKAADMLEEFFKREADETAERVKRRATSATSEPKHNETDLPRAQTGSASGDAPRTLTNALAADGASSTGDVAASKAPLSRPARIRAQREQEAADLRRIEALARR